MAEIVIPSHGRPTKVVTLGLFDRMDDVWLCLAESQEEAYRASYPSAKYLIHPDTIVGLAPKRQWIYEQMGDVFMLDDDVNLVQDNASKPGEPNKVRGDRLIDVINRMEDLAKDVGCKLYGFAAAGNPMAYQAMNPYRFTMIVQEHCFGLIKEDSQLWFNPEIVGASAEWLACLNMYHHRIGLFDTRYGFGHTGTFTAAGGQQGVRTRASRENDVDRLQETFGSEIVERVPMVDDTSNFAAFLGCRVRFPW